MDKLLIVVPSFHNGGTISSLKNILPVLKKIGCIVDVFAITNEGPNFDYISQYANILGQRIGDDKSDKKKELEVKDMLFRFVFKTVKWTKKQLCKIGIDISESAFKYSVIQLQKNNYNVVVAFQEGQATKYISLFDNVKKIAWIRCDYSSMLKISGGEPQHHLYEKINQIVCVSDYTKSVFTRLLPETVNKTISLHNLIDTQRIINGATTEEGLDNRFCFEGFRIVSLGRIDPVKQFSKIPEIAKQLVNKGCVFKWYILGGKASDDEYNLLLSNISIFNVADYVILLGEKNNPYPYIKQANLLVCTSVSEACPNVINEAKILHTPVVSSNFGSAKEFITDGVDGFVMPIETIADKIEMLIEDKNAYNQIANNISTFEYDNEIIVETLKHLLCH